MISITPSTSLLLIGLGFLGYGFHSKRMASNYFSPVGWVLTGTSFALQTTHYLEIHDPILAVMAFLALPVGLGLAWWEVKNTILGEMDDTLTWFRGAVFWSGLPYLLIEQVPILYAGAIIFVAWQTTLFLRWTGASDVEMSELRVNQISEGGQEYSTDWASWGGEHLVMPTGMGEHPLTIPLIDSGTGIEVVTIILGCTALQSMMIFVGGIGALDISLKRKVKGLLVVLPLIHILNVFRNGGIVWLVQAYPDWSFLGMGIFEFSHAWAAKFGSLFSMFLIALVLFEILPESHRHILRLLSPFTQAKDKS